MLASYAASSSSASAVDRRNQDLMHACAPHDRTDCAMLREQSLPATIVKEQHVASLLTHIHWIRETFGHSSLNQAFVTFGRLQLQQLQRRQLCRGPNGMYAPSTQHEHAVALWQVLSLVRDQHPR